MFQSKIQIQLLSHVNNKVGHKKTKDNFSPWSYQIVSWAIDVSVCGILFKSKTSHHHCYSGTSHCSHTQQITRVLPVIVNSGTRPQQRTYLQHYPSKKIKLKLKETLSKGASYQQQLNKK